MIEWKYLVYNYEIDLILLILEDGKVFEFDIGNIVIEEDGKWYILSYKDDFLKGCMCDYLIDSDKFVEKDFNKNELIYKYYNNEICLFLINSLWEVVDVYFCF